MKCEQQSLEWNEHNNKMPPWILEEIKRTAARRDGKSQGNLMCKKNNQNVVGLCGEFAFGELIGKKPDTGHSYGGDGGVDFEVPFLTSRGVETFSVDVKTKEEKVMHLTHNKSYWADIYVMAKFNGDNWATLIGWEWGSVIKNSPLVKSMPQPAPGIWWENLRPMAELERRLTSHG